MNYAYIFRDSHHIASVPVIATEQDVREICTTSKVIVIQVIKENMDNNIAWHVTTRPRNVRARFVHKLKHLGFKG